MTADFKTGDVVRVVLPFKTPGKEQYCPAVDSIGKVTRVRPDGMVTVSFLLPIKAHDGHMITSFREPDKTTSRREMRITFRPGELIKAEGF